MLEFFVLTILGAFTLAAIFSPVMGLYAFLIIAYTRPQDYFEWLTTISPAKIVLFITVFSFLFNVLVKKTFLVKSKQNIGILLIFVCILISGVFAPDKTAWSAATFDFISVLLVYFLIINSIRNKINLRNFFFFFLIINLIVAIRFIFACHQGTAVIRGNRPGDFSIGFLGNADDLGLGMLVALSCSLPLIIYAKEWFHKIIATLIAVIFIVAIFWTDARGSQFGVIAVFSVFIIMHLNRAIFRSKHAMFGLLIILFLFAGFWKKYSYNIHESYTTVQDESDSGRIGREATWSAAKQMIKDRPLFGVGRGNFVQYWINNYPPGVYGYQVAHNVFYEVTSEIGIVGLLSYLFFSLFGIIEIFFIKRRYSSFLKKNMFFNILFNVYLIALFGFYFNGMTITVGFYWHIFILVAIFVCTKKIFLEKVVHEKTISAKTKT